MLKSNDAFFVKPKDQEVDFQNWKNATEKKKPSDITLSSISLYIKDGTRSAEMRKAFVCGEVRIR